MSKTHEYLFDIELSCSIRVKAKSRTEAVKLIEDSLDCNTANLGEWPDGEPIICEVSLLTNGDPLTLAEVDGEAV